MIYRETKGLFIRKINDPAQRCLTETSAMMEMFSTRTAQI